MSVIKNCIKNKKPFRGLFCALQQVASRKCINHVRLCKVALFTLGSYASQISEKDSLKEKKSFKIQNLR